MNIYNRLPERIQEIIDDDIYRTYHAANYKTCIQNIKTISYLLNNQMYHTKQMYCYAEQRPKTINEYMTYILCQTSDLGPSMFLKKNIKILNLFKCTAHLILF